MTVSPKKHSIIYPVLQEIGKAATALPIISFMGSKEKKVLCINRSPRCSSVH